MSTYQSQFAPYAPPPDDPSRQSQPAPAATPSRFKRPWFPAHASSQQVISSYQSGAVPTFNDSQAGGASAADAAESQTNQWETRFGMRVDMLAAFAYVLGPVSAFLLLVIETQNDYVRFHAYQSALLTSPLLLIRILASLAGFTPWLRSFFTLCIICIEAYMAFRAYIDAVRNGLARFQLPIIGQWADSWVGEE